jgi:ketosteroid isomerase-like protein
MIYYQLDLKSLPLLASLPVSGAVVSAADIVQFVPWQPSRWPDMPDDDHDFVMVLKRIFEQSILIEIKSVIEDATARNGNVEHRGHVLAISMLCALDTISSYGYGAKSGKQIPEFIKAHFPKEYRPFAESILHLYRHAVVHSWNLFQVAITPGNDPPSKKGGVISFGLLNLFDALKRGTEDFLTKLSQNATLKSAARARYKSLRNSAKAFPLTKTQRKRVQAAPDEPKTKDYI